MKSVDVCASLTKSDARDVVYFDEYTWNDGEIGAICASDGMKNARALQINKAVV